MNNNVVGVIERYSELRTFSTAGIRSSIYNATKRMFDVVMALIGVVFLIPVTILVKIAFMLSGDFGKIFFTQNRIGLNGKEFKLYKFRSMVPNADAILQQILEEDGPMAKEYRLTKKLANDPRVTKTGRFIRKYSIDELPQLINILKGDISLVGNRPYLPREKEDMSFYYNDIVKTKPALTGLWQVSGRSNTTFEDRLKLEQFYSNNCNFLIDIKIFFDTFKVVLFHKGAK